MKYKSLIIVATLIVLSNASSAQEGVGLSFYRGVNGAVTQASNENAKAMRDFANTNGHIDLWLTLNYNYNLYPEQMTPEEIEIQRVQVEQGFNLILSKLIEKGDARYPKAGQILRGPACAVRVSKQGLKKLLKDDRLIQIVAMNVGKEPT